MAGAEWVEIQRARACDGSELIIRQSIVVNPYRVMRAAIVRRAGESRRPAQSRTAV